MEDEDVQREDIDEKGKKMTMMMTKMLQPMMALLQKTVPMI